MRRTRKYHLLHLSPMSSTETSRKPEKFIDFNQKSVQDTAFALAGFLTIILILTHYAWIMRQLVVNRDLTTEQIVVYFVLLGFTVVGSLVFLMKVVYKRIYGADIDLSKKEQ